VAPIAVSWNQLGTNHHESTPVEARRGGSVRVGSAWPLAGTGWQYEAPCHGWTTTRGPGRSRPAHGDLSVNWTECTAPRCHRADSVE
jgi:hypothetical protein